jgi:hypothetical protein
MSFWISQAYEIRTARGEVLADGRKRLTRFIAWKQNNETQDQLTYTYGDADAFPGTAPTGWTGLLLAKIEADNSPANNGAGNDPVIQLTYETPGTVTERDDTRNNGALSLKTIVSFWTTPATPSGYTLVGTNTENVNGFAYKTYSYAKGNGQISREDDTRNDGALLLATITHLTAPGASDPVSTLAGYTRISITNSEQDGHELWRAVFAKGDGEISRTIDYSQSSDQGTTGITRTVIRHLVVPGATVQPTTLSGSVEIGRDYQDLDGHRMWTTTWAKGTGLVVDESTISASGVLVVYHRVALGTAPTAPAATIGGTVTLFESSERLEAGFNVYDRRWAEGNGQASIETRADPEGALVYAVTDYNVAATTPSYPGGGTAYLINLTQVKDGGYFRNTAVYKKPPASQTRRQTIEWQKPGLASFTSNQLTLSPPTTRTLLGSVAVTYSTTQDTTAPFEVEAYSSLVETWVPTDTGIAQSRQRGLGGYLAGSSSISGTNSNYNGVLCDSWSAVLVSSIPSTRPTGTVLLRVDNDPYITATDGTTVVYRITKVSISI